MYEPVASNQSVEKVKERSEWQNCWGSGKGKYEGRHVGIICIFKTMRNVWQNKGNNWSIR